MVVDLADSRSAIVFQTLPVDERRPYITYARGTLGWTPHTDLKDGLECTIAHFDALLPEASREGAVRR